MIILQHFVTFVFRFGPRFPAMSQAYDLGLRNQAKKLANELGFNFVQEGVYVIQTGPCFETVTECRMLKAMGADVTGKREGRSGVFEGQQV